MKHILKQLVAMILVGGMLICPTLAATFPDVDDNAEYIAAVEFVSSVGIMIGDDQGNFNPNKTVSRAEMATILCSLFGDKENLSTDGGVFVDVPASHWANKYIIKAVSVGVVVGYGDGRFGPADGLTYEQAVTMVVNALGGKSEAIEAGGYPDGYLGVAKAGGLLEGISAQKGDELSRAEVAVIMYNCLF